MRMMAAPNNTGHEARNCSIGALRRLLVVRFGAATDARSDKEASTMALRTRPARVEARSARDIRRDMGTVADSLERSSQVQFTFLCWRARRGGPVETSRQGAQPPSMRGCGQVGA